MLSKGRITKDKTLVYSRKIKDDYNAYQRIYVYRGKHGLYYLEEVRKHWKTSEIYLKGLEHKYNQHLIMIGDCVRFAFKLGDIK